MENSELLFFFGFFGFSFWFSFWFSFFFSTECTAVRWVQSSRLQFSKCNPVASAAAAAAAPDRPVRSRESLSLGPDQDQGQAT